MTVRHKSKLLSHACSIHEFYHGADLLDFIP